MRGAHGHSLGGRVAWAVAGLLSAGGHWAEEWELLKYPHTGAHMFTHTGAHPGTQHTGLHPPVHGTESRRHVCMFTHVCAHAKSQKCLRRSRGQWLLVSLWAGAVGGVSAGRTAESRRGPPSLLTHSRCRRAPRTWLPQSREAGWMLGVADSTFPGTHQNSYLPQLTSSVALGKLLGLSEPVSSSVQWGLSWLVWFLCGAKARMHSGLCGQLLVTPPPWGG